MERCDGKSEDFLQSMDMCNSESCGTENIDGQYF